MLTITFLNAESRKLRNLLPYIGKVNKTYASSQDGIKRSRFNLSAETMKKAEIYFKQWFKDTGPLEMKTVISERE